LDLPLLLAGPILRRVEPGLVSVWIALSEAASVRLLIWEGRVAAGRDDPFVTSDESLIPDSPTAAVDDPKRTTTVRVGDKLHLAQVTARAPEASAKSFLPDQLYCYDLDIKAGGRTETLSSLGLLSSADDADGTAHVPLGYEDKMLPTFAPPPSELDNLRLLYGSCRRPGHANPDAMVWIDDFIREEDRYKDPRRRPHQLFLGGDQIYADDMATLHMLLVTELGPELIGRTGGTPIEHVKVNRTMRRTSQPDPAEPHASYVLEDAAAAGTLLPVDSAHFPERRRLELTRRGAQLTSGDGVNHLISVGEFAATYVTVWSNACWGDEIPHAKVLVDPGDEGTRRPLRWSDELPDEAVIELPALAFPERIAEHLFPDPSTKPKPVDLLEKIQPGLHDQLRILDEFRQGLPRVQRALANVPTYMIFDDHDVTDDFFLNPMWRDRVLSTHLGQAILGNALLTYALFQDWGNDPLRYTTEPRRRELLSHARALFPEGAAKGPDDTPATALARLFGHDLSNQPQPDGGFASVKPPILWHFSVDGPKHRVVALDNRTRRSYRTRSGPPGNVSITALEDQIPKPPLPAGVEILVVIAPLQVIGPPVLDEIIAPLTYRIFDLAHAAGNDPNLSRDSLSGLREMLGTNPDAIEAWTFDPVTFEHLLTRLEPYRRVVLLSGDVHNSSGSLMSYWRGNEARPARIAQFTSSGFKNVMPPMITAADRSAGFLQQFVRAGLGVERIGWNRPEDDLVLLPAGKTETDLTPVMRSRLRTTPVMIPTWGWLVDARSGVASRLNPARPPDWRWRIKPLRDERSDAERPEPIRPLELDDDAIESDLDDPDKALSAYAAIATRHQHALGHMRNARQILFRSNFGLVRFVSDDGRIDAVHEVYTAFADPDQPTAEPPKPQPYLFQIAPLGPEDEDPPGPLRDQVITRVPVPPPVPPEDDS
jgi:hypothetical protein